jgi:hypothetical protein
MLDDLMLPWDDLALEWWMKPEGHAARRHQRDAGARHEV